jgi:hypothetical protein
MCCSLSGTPGLPQEKICRPQATARKANATHTLQPLFLKILCAQHHPALHFCVSAPLFSILSLQYFTRCFFTPF